MYRERWCGLLVVTCTLGLGSATACGESERHPAGEAGSSGASSGSPGSSAGSAQGGASAGGTGGGGATSNGGDTDEPGGNAAAGEVGAGGAPEPELLTCRGAMTRVGAVGCEFWPTFVANPVVAAFLPGLALANEGIAPSDVVIEGPNGFRQELTLAAGESTTVELAWVPELKGPQWLPSNMSGARASQSTRVSQGAYRVTSSLPIAVWQFNPLRTARLDNGCVDGAATCRASSGDGTALLPTSALTGNYRVFGYASRNEGADWGTVPGGIAITATKDGTNVLIQAGPHCGTELIGTSSLGPCTVAGGGLSALTAGGVLRLTLNAGEVVQLMGATATAPTLKNADLSGTLLEASQPLQVISFNTVANVPDDSVPSASHLEELLPAAEFLSTDYVVVPPTTPAGSPGSHVVRLFGHIDGTQLTYPSGKPPGAPDVLNAGDVVQLPTPSNAVPAPACLGTADHCVTAAAFIVHGNYSFAVASYLPGGALQTPGADSTTSRGDPASAFLTATDQFDENCSFFIPDDYASAYVDVILPSGAELTLDDVASESEPTLLAQSDWGVHRLPVVGSGWHQLSTNARRGMAAYVSASSSSTSLYYAACARGRLLTEPPVIILP